MGEEKIIWDEVPYESSRGIWFCKHVIETNRLAYKVFNLTAKEMGLLFIFKFNLNEDNLVMSDGGIPTLDSIAEYANISYRTLRKMLKTLEEKKVLKLFGRGNRTRIYISPYYMKYIGEYEEEIDLKDYICEETLQMFGLN